MVIAQLTTDNREPFREYHKKRPWFGTAPEALLQGFAGMQGVEVHVVACTKQPMESPARLAGNIAFHCLHVSQIGWMRTGFQGCIRAVRKRLREIRPDIVHGQGTERDSAISAVLSGFPNVVTIHGNMAELARLFRAPLLGYSWIAARLENFTLSRTAGVFCNSEYTERLVRARARRTWRVPNAIRKEFFGPRDGMSAPGKPILMNVGVVCERKRQLELLDLAQNMHRRGLKFQFHFAGLADPHSAYVAAFFDKLKPLEAAGCARYLGQKSTSELIECFDQAAALVHFPAEEAFGLVVAEALARDLKFFGARVGGIMDITVGVESADLCDAEDWAGLEGAIARWIKNGHPRPVGAARLIGERYHPEVIARRHLEIYTEVLRST